VANNYQKKNYVKTCFFAFLAVSFFVLSTGGAVATELEVKYPVIAGQTLTTTTKLPDYMLYLFNAGMFIGFFAVFLSLVIAGAMWLLSPAKPDLLAEAKDRISGAISGLLILALTYLIIATINPQLSIFKLAELPSTPTTPVVEKKAPGVYFYAQAGCSNVRVNFNTSSVPDLGDLKNKVHAVDIVQNPDTKTSYISILYDNVGLWGKCQYIDPNSSCETVEPFAASASVHRYDFSPNGDGVYFYRKPCFNEIDKSFGSMAEMVAYCNTKTGGYYKVKNSEIKSKGVYEKKLEDLIFTGVPEEEQDCIKYDESGDCVSRSMPSLGGENISSIIINGDYLVLFTYAGPGEKCSDMQLTSCQEFPTAGDTNKLGPQQMKWENIRNNSGVIPNCVTIVPIK